MLDHSDQYTYLKQIEERLCIDSVYDLDGASIFIRTSAGMPRTIVAMVMAIEVSGVRDAQTVVKIALLTGVLAVVCNESGMRLQYVSNDHVFSSEDIEVEVS